MYMDDFLSLIQYKVMNKPIVLVETAVINSTKHLLSGKFKFFQFLILSGLGLQTIYIKHISMKCRILD